MNVADLLRQGAEHHRAARFAQAERCYRQALERQPACADAWHLLGLIAHEAAQNGPAAAHIQQAIALDPNRPAFFTSLGTVCQAEGDLDKAVECYGAALRLDPGNAAALNNRAEVYKEQGLIRAALADYRQAVARDPTAAQVHSNLLYALNLDPDTRPDEIAAEHRAWGQRHGSPPGQRGNHSHGREPERPLRIGYLSPDFRNHAVMRFFLPILEHHDRQRFRVFLYAEIARPSPVTAQVRALADGWYGTVGRTAEEVARQIEADQVDLLIDLAGHTAHNRLDVLALKPAPVQATYLGYPNTTGLAAMDCWLTDAVLCPPDEPTGAVERLVRLPGGISCFAPPESAPAVAPLPALARGSITFGSHHQLGKLNDRVFALWRQVLDQVSQSRLVLMRAARKPGDADRYRRGLLAQGVEPGRIEVRQPALDDNQYLAAYHDIDLVLDAFPYTGCTTTCEALWMGVPVLTLFGDRPAGRLSASVLTALGLPEWIARSPEEYVARARDLAGDVGRLAALRADLRERVRQRLGNGAAFTRQLEAVYRDLWRDWCRPAPAAAGPADVNRRGLELAQQGHYAEAADCFAVLTRAQPDSVPAWSNLGNALKNAGQLEEAETALVRATELAGEDLEARASLADLYKLQYRFAEARDGYQQALRTAPPFHPAWHNYLFMLHYGPDWDAHFIAAEHQAWGQRVPVAEVPPYTNGSDPERKLHVGYVSPDLRWHPVARFLEPILANHDRRRFAVTLYAEVPDPDEVSRRLMALADGWRPTAGRAAAEVAAQVRADRIDILVDLAGHTAHNRLDVFALRPAPVQLTYLGYPGATGLPTLGWRLTDAVLDPPGGPEPPTERPIRLPAGFACFAPPPAAPAVAPAPILRNGHVTFGIHHNLAKLNDRVLDLYAQVLAAVPGSRLLFFRSSYTPAVARRLRDRLAQRKVDAIRVEVRQPPRAEAAYLAVHADVDLVLDSFPFAGHTTTCEALWQGVPVLTGTGDRFAGRLAASVLTSLCLPELVVADWGTDFIERARRLASDPARLAALRAQLRPRVRSHLTIGAAFVPCLEEVYRQLWREACATGQTARG